MTIARFPTLGIRADIGNNVYEPLGLVENPGTAVINSIRAEEQARGLPPRELPDTLYNFPEHHSGVTRTDIEPTYFHVRTAHRTTNNLRTDLFIVAHEEGHAIHRLGRLDGLETLFRAQGWDIDMRTLNRNGKAGSETIAELAGFFSCLRRGYTLKNTYQNIAERHTTGAHKEGLETAYRLLRTTTRPAA